MFKISSRIMSHVFSRTTPIENQLLFRRFTHDKSKRLDDVTQDRINGYVKSDNIVVFMKGTQDQPLCGFSMNVKRILDLHEVKFKDYNVLTDEKLREGIKIYSDWPTIPQVYIKGNFVGGSDILIQLHKDGEITALFDEHKIPSRFSDDYPSTKNDN